MVGCRYDAITFEGNDIIKIKEINDISSTKPYILQIEDINLKSDFIKINFLDSQTSLIKIETNENILETIDVKVIGNLIKITGDRKYIYDTKDFVIDVINIKFSKLNLEGLFHLTDEIGNFDSSLDIDLNGIINGDIDLEKVTKEVKFNLDGIINLIIENVSLNKIRFDMDGEINIDAVGNANTLTVNTDGIVNLDFRKLEVEDATIDMDGFNDAAFFVKNSIEMAAKGHGKISYYGNPKTEKIFKDGFVEVIRKAS